MLKKAIKVCLSALAFMPLIVDTNVFFPFVTGKNLFIEIALFSVSILFLINFLYSRDFRLEITEKTGKFLKSPLVISVLTFFFIFIISTFFAVDKYSAFWGEISHAEGLAGMMYFLSFFVFSLLIFEREDWLWFFKLSLFTGFILVFKEFDEYLGGITRPSSFSGNPTFLAGYLLFSISASLIVLNEVKDKFWRYFSIIVVVLSFLGIFIAQTRGTILGLALGITGVLIYCAFKGKDISYSKFNLRKISIIILGLGIVFSLIFISTRGSELWQKIPGLSRVAVINTGVEGDLSSTARLMAYQSSLKAANPIQNGWQKFLIGWGPENYILAFGQYYNPALYKIQADWDDRPHNKPLEVLVVNGLFGLLAYLAIWFVLFKAILKRKVFSLINLGLLFFGVSFFTHLFFVFDQITTSIAFFAVLGFTVYLGAQSVPERPKTAQNDPQMANPVIIPIGTLLAILTVFLGLFLLKGTIPSYIQTKKSFDLANNFNPSVLDSRLDSILTPFTTAERYMLKGLQDVAVKNYGKKADDQNLKLLEDVLSKGESYASSQPYDVIFLASLADTFTKEGNILKSYDYESRGEKYFKQALNLAPNRPDINYGLAINLFYQKKYPESFSYFEKSFAPNPQLFVQDGKLVEGFYTYFIQYFYQQKDKDNFIKTAARLKANNFSSSSTLDQIINYLNTNGIWPQINFE